jgi:anti-sigma B factor antagonist
MAGMLRISVSARPSLMLVSLGGECDITMAPQLLAVLAQIPPGRHRVVLDLSRLRFIDAAGVHALLDAQKALTAREGSLALAAPQRIVGRVLEITGADQIIALYEHVAQATAPH